MNNRGFTLVELFVVVAIITALFAIGMMNFDAWRRKTQVERFTKEFYSDLQDARMRAAFHKQPQTVQLTTNAAGNSQVVFQGFSNDGAVIPIRTETKDYPFVFLQNAAGIIRFDTRGVMGGAITRVICAQPNVGAAHNALILNQTITSLGKFTNTGGGCAAQYVETK